MNDGVNIERVEGGIRDSKLAGRDIIEVSITNIESAGLGTPSSRNLNALLDHLTRALPRLHGARAAETEVAIDALKRTLEGLATHEHEFLGRVVERYSEDAPYYVSLAGQTTELSQEPATATGRARHRQQRRAVADYCEWIPAQREIARVKLESLEEGIQKYPCVVLLGDPGSGKTTAIEMLAFRLARVALDGGSHVLPLSLRLSEFGPGMTVEGFLAQGLSGSREGDHWDAAPLALNLEGYLEEGRLFVLLDALNEMPQDGYGERVVQLRQFIDRWQSRGNRFLVSCRVLDYGEDFQGLQRIEILPLSNEQIQQFVLSELVSGDPAAEALWELLPEIESAAGSQRVLDHLARALDRSGRLEQWNSLAAALAPGEGTEGLLGMARNPYLLTVIIDVFLTEGRFDLNRAQLMASFARIQLNWARHKVTPDKWLDADLLVESLSVLAFEFQQRARFGTVVKTEQVKAVMPTEVQTDPNWPAVPAPPDQVLRLATSSNIIEMPADRSTVRFYHQLLQEYFAARSLLSRDLSSLHELWRWPWREDEMPPAGERSEYEPLPPPPPTGWEETTIIAAQLAAEDHSELVRELRNANPILAARCLYGLRDAADPGQRALIVETLLTIIADPEVSLRVRIAAGDVLGNLGDPRVGEWVTIVAGRFTMGAPGSADEHELELPQYSIGTFPVTNLEYGRFVAAGGYQRRDYWTDAGWAWRGEIMEPDNWADSWFNRPNYPVVGVSWYEAAAYCRFASEQEQREIRLPTEAEWEKAARGDDGRRYPWGNEFGAGSANLRIGSESVNRTTPVGVYPTGASPYRLMDCAGEVWEWCATPTSAEYVLRAYDGSEARYDEASAEGTLARALRGASWTDRSPAVAVCDYREWFYPDFRAADRGFRLVAA